jgi:hypothetical protein
VVLPGQVRCAVLRGRFYGACLLARYDFKFSVFPLNEGRTEGVPRPHHRTFTGDRFISGEYQAGVFLAGCVTANDDIVWDPFLHD